MKKTVISVLLLAALGTAAYAASIRFGGTEQALQAALVSRGTVSAFVSATGSVINREELIMNSPVSGQLLEVHANEGDAVGAGQLLARFEGREQAVAINKAAALVDSVVQRSVAAASDSERLQRVFEVGGESRKTVEDAQLRVVTLRAERTMAEQSLRQARYELDKLTLKAPRRSLVTARLARTGAWVRAGDPLFKLAPSHARSIEAKLDASDSAMALPGKAVSVSSDAYPDKTWEEKITWVSPSTSKDGAANTLTIHISLNAGAPPLALGQQVDVKLTSDSASNVLQLPSNAIIVNQGQARVAVLANGRVHLKAVTTGIESVRMTEIKGGLLAGEKVALPNGQALHEGDRARFMEDRR